MPMGSNMARRKGAKTVKPGGKVAPRKYSTSKTVKPGDKNKTSAKFVKARK